MIEGHYCQEFISKCTPYFIQGFNSIYKNTLKKCSKRKYLLKEFQEALESIPLWNSKIIENEYSRFKNASNCNWLEDLIKAAFVELSEIISKEKRNINEDIPNGEVFIHKCYINIAREIWRKPQLFYHDYSKQEITHNQSEITKIIHDGISKTIRNELPLKTIVNEYLHQQHKPMVEEDTVVEKNISSSEMDKEVYDEVTDEVDVNNEVIDEVDVNNVDNEVIDEVDVNNENNENSSKYGLGENRKTEESTKMIVLNEKNKSDFLNDNEEKVGGCFIEADHTEEVDHDETTVDDKSYTGFNESQHPEEVDHTEDVDHVEEVDHTEDVDHVETTVDDKSNTGLNESQYPEEVNRTEEPDHDEEVNHTETTVDVKSDTGLNDIQYHERTKNDTVESNIELPKTFVEETIDDIYYDEFVENNLDNKDTDAIIAEDVSVYETLDNDLERKTESKNSADESVHAKMNDLKNEVVLKVHDNQIKICNDVESSDEEDFNIRIDERDVNESSNDFVKNNKEDRINMKIKNTEKVKSILGTSIEYDDFRYNKNQLKKKLLLQKKYM